MQRIVLATAAPTGIAVRSWHVRLDEAKLDRFSAAAEAAGLRPTAPVSIGALRHPALIDQWYREKGMPAFSQRSAMPWRP